MENSMDSKSTTVFEVVNRGNASTELKFTITKLKVSSNAMGQEMKYDSDEKNNEGPSAEIFGAKVNKSKSITIDAKGNIIKQDEDEDEDAGMMGLDGGIDNKLDLFIPVLFTKKLKAGNSFPDAIHIKKEKYESNETGTYTIVAVENGIASIVYVGKQVISATMEQMGMEMINNSTNNIKSDIQVDINTRLVLTKSSVTESTMTIETGGMSIPSTAKSTVTVKITTIY